MSGPSPATDFFERQDRARKNTVRLVLLFSLVFAFLTAGSYLALGLVFDVLAVWQQQEPVAVLHWLTGEEFSIHWEIMAGAAAFTAVIIAGGSVSKTLELKKGGTAVAEELGGTEVDATSNDPLVRRYVNVVEEMSLASGVPVPRTYVLENENGINAFAAGYTVNDAAVAVTRGALRQLERAELQGVVAHEFSHILNGDMRLNIRLIGLIHGILGIYLAGTVFLSIAKPSRNSSARNSEGGALLAVIPGIIFTVAGLGGMMGSSLIKGGISRQREYLADAAAVQFTRNPKGLAGALKKIGGLPGGSRLTAARAEEVSHMCFGSVSSRRRLTHPSLEDRIQALDPSFDPVMGFKKLDPDVQRAGLDKDGEDTRTDSAGTRDGSVEPGGDSVETGDDRESEAPELEAGDIVEAIGTTSPEHLVYCATLLESIPEELRQARSTLAGGIAIAYLLLLDEDDDERQKQAEIIERHAGTAVRQQAQRLWPLVRSIDEAYRLPVMDLLVPTLRRMTEDQFETFATIAHRLIEVDDEVSLRQFVLEHVVLHRLESAFGDSSRRSVKFRSISKLRRELEQVLSAVAWSGADEPVVADGQFEEGRRFLPNSIRDDVELRKLEALSFQEVGASLERLSRASPRIKQTVVDACAHCALGDAKVVVGEVQVLRAICESLDVPLPPLITRHTRRDAP